VARIELQSRCIRLRLHDALLSTGRTTDGLAGLRFQSGTSSIHSPVAPHRRHNHHKYTLSSVGSFVWRENFLSIPAMKVSPDQIIPAGQCCATVTLWPRTGLQTVASAFRFLPAFQASSSASHIECLQGCPTFDALLFNIVAISGRVRIPNRTHGRNDRIESNRHTA
jgi:hypothetical protein